jgi:hypothetical protein
LRTIFDNYRRIAKPKAAVYVGHTFPWQRELQDALEANGFTIASQIKHRKVRGRVGGGNNWFWPCCSKPNLEKAAASLGISAVTAWRITKTPEFQEEYRAAQ